MDKSEMVESLVNYYASGNKRQFASMLDVSAQTISAWISRGTFDAELIHAKCSGVSAEWLLTGEGEMLKKDDIKSRVKLSEEKSKELAEICAKIADNYLETNELMVRLSNLMKKG